jgi:dTDP-4-dehydrorhamnose reductase
MLKKVLVSGASGQLGLEIKDLASSFNNLELHFFDSTSWDITDKEKTKSIFDEYKPDFFINCAAYTAVDKAESDIEKCYEINANALHHLAEICNFYKVHIIHVSTDFVFDGNKNTPYEESDTTNPISVYGKSKLQGEIILLNTSDSFNIIRTSWVYSKYGSNFVKTMLRLAQERKELNIVIDQIGSPTYAKDLASFILENINHLKDKNKEIYHYSNQGVASWYDFAYEIFKIKNISIKLTPINSDQFPTPSSRPKYSLMNKNKLNTDFGMIVEHWKESLLKCLQTLN